MKPCILAFDTSSPGVSVAFFDGSKTHAFIDATSARQSESLFTSIEKLLAQRKARLADIDALAVGIGPGSFTGLRVGVSSAKAFAYALKKKLIGISSLQAVYAAHGRDCLRVVQDARRGNVFTASFAAGRMIGKPQVVAIEDFLKTLKAGDRVAGSALVIFKDQIERAIGSGAAIGTAETWQPRAEHLIPESHRRYSERCFDDPLELVPDYLFDQTCTVTRPNPRKSFLR